VGPAGQTVLLGDRHLVFDELAFDPLTQGRTAFAIGMMARRLWLCTRPAGSDQEGFA
jgi:hypothetical protein